MTEMTSGAGLGASHTDWAAVAARLASVDPDQLSADELDLLAEARFWTDEVADSVDIRRRAYRAYCAIDDDRGAGLAAWRLFYDHFLVGEAAVASGWLERCRSHATSAADAAADDAANCALEGWLAVADCDAAMATGDLAAAAPAAERAGACAATSGDPDLRAMALQARGRVEIASGHRQRGLSRLDEAMVAVVNEELQPLFTGWVFCNVVSTCYGLADLRRATEWSDAAMRWCRSLRDGLLYPGLCRVYAAELARLSGDWVIAEAGARRASTELERHDPRYAGAAYYTVGDLCRLRGAVADAEVAFERAHELGRDPHPGLALLRAEQGHLAEAITALRTAIRPGPGDPLRRIQLALALAELAAACEDSEAAGEAEASIADVLLDDANPVLQAYRAAIGGLAMRARGDARSAASTLRTAVAGFVEVGLPYESARARLHLGLAAARLGDDDTARMETNAAVATLERLGASVACVPAGGAGGSRSDASIDAPIDAPISGREVEVLHRVAAGDSNREIAERLTISEHTVARHVSNILTKLGVTSRAAATAAGYELGLIGSSGPRR